MLRSLSHITVHSADFELTERFYCGLLGLRLGPRPVIKIPGHWFYLGDRAVVHMLPREPEKAAGSGGAFDHFAFDADDLPAFLRKFEALGVPFEGRRLADSQVWQVFLTDPDGVRVELSFQMPPS